MLKTTHNCNKFVSVVAILCLALFVSCNLESSASLPASEQVGSISGRVLFSNSNDNSGILVSLEQTDGLKSLSANSKSLAGSTSTGSDGSYRFKDVKPGVYTLYAAHNSSLERASVVRNIVVEAGKALTLDDLYLTATADISGRVMIDNDETGNLGFIVFIAGTSYVAITDDSGNFRISGVPIGQSYLIAAMKGSSTVVLSASTYFVSTAEISLGNYNISSSSLEGQGSLVWKGSYSSAPENPKTNWAYFNTTDGCSYIYYENTWNLLARAGQNAVSIIWLGALDNPPDNPGRLNAYFNLQTGCSYIFDGSNWTLLAQAGANGAVGAAGSTGATGVDGQSIRWLGSFDAAPENPSALDAYFNILDGSSYIYTGAGWSLLARGLAHEHTYVTQWASNETLHWHESSCGHAYSKGHMTEHEWDSGTIVEAATCTATGVVRYMCTVCSYEKQESIEKATHQYSVTSTTEPTCTVDGLIIQTCSNCGDTVKTIVLTLGHDFGTDNVCDICSFVKENDHTHDYEAQVVAPTCTQMGYTFYTCSMCSDSYKENIVEPLGHSWNEGFVTTTKTCATDGIITFTCTRGGCNESRQEIVPAGHEYEYVIIIPATCTTSGLRTAVCKVCGSTTSEDPISASHTWDEGTIKVEATCTSDGSILYKCTVCGEEEHVVVKATGHAYKNGVCEVCNHNFIDDVVQDIDYPQYGMYFRIKDIKSAYGNKLINTYGVYLDHNADAQIDKVGVYLTQDGTMWRRVLAFKGSNITSAYYVPFLSFDSDIFYTGFNTSSINTFKLTKNADGIYTYGNYATIGVNLADSTGKLLLTLNHVGQAGAKTQVFNDLDEMIAWLNEGEHTHSFGEWKVTTEPTCIENGTKERTCSICGEVQAERVAPIGHSFSAAWVYDDTYHWHTSICEHNGLISDKTKHILSTWTIVRQVTSEQPGLMVRDCEECGYKEEQEILSDGVSYISYTWDSVNNLLSSYELSTSDYTDVTEETTTWSTGWYVVSRDVVIKDRIVVEGSVNVILCDGITLTAEGGIRLTKENTLNIYSQKDGNGLLISKRVSSYCASIGGNNVEDLCGNFNLYGGTVTADAGWGAGIGGGEGGSGGTTAIYGGTVTIAASRGAGIGGGEGGPGGTTTIYGGTVNVTDVSWGAGIGGGEGGSGGTTTIYGGTVNVIDASWGAGIGGGYNGSGGTITINGGTVNVTDASWGAGIGGGYNGSGGTIAINGGTVDATGITNGVGPGSDGTGGSLYIGADMVCSHGKEVYFTGPGFVTDLFSHMKVYSSSSSSAI